MRPGACHACLLLTVAALLSRAALHEYRRESGTISGPPSVTVTTPSRLTCAIRCSQLKPQFCLGFTYLEDGRCRLYGGQEDCLGLRRAEARATLQLDASTAEPPSYRRIQWYELSPDSCPGGSRDALSLQMTV